MFKLARCMSIQEQGDTKNNSILGSHVVRDMPLCAHYAHRTQRTSTELHSFCIFLRLNGQIHRAQIPRMSHHTWPHVTSLSLFQIQNYIKILILVSILEKCWLCLKGDLLCKYIFLFVWPQPAYNGKNPPTHLFII